jgi:hypothetical protein
MDRHILCAIRTSTSEPFRLFETSVLYHERIPFDALASYILVQRPSLWTELTYPDVLARGPGYYSELHLREPSRLGISPQFTSPPRRILGIRALSLSRSNVAYFGIHLGRMSELVLVPAREAKPARNLTREQLFAAAAEEDLHSAIAFDLCVNWAYFGDSDLNEMFVSNLHVETLLPADIDPFGHSL